VGKIKPANWQTSWPVSTFNLFWVDKDGHMFLIDHEQDLEIGTKEMLRTACSLAIIASPS